MDSTPLNRDRVRELILQGRKKKAENSLTRLNEEIEDLRKVRKTLEGKVEAVMAEIAKSSSSIDQLKSEIHELTSVKEGLPEEDYTAALALLTTDLNTAEERRNALDQERMSLSDEAQARGLDISRLMDRKASLTDPDHRPKFQENLTTEAFLPECSAEIANAYRRAVTLPNRVMEYDKHLAAVTLLLEIETRWLRMQQTLYPAINAAETLVYRRAFGIVLRLVRDYSVPHIASLSPTYQRADWSSYHREAVVNFELCRAGLRKDQPGHKPKTPPTEPVELEDAEDLQLVTEILEAGLPKALSTKRVAFIGGRPTQRSAQFLMTWLEEALTVKSLRWFECFNSVSEASKLETSIKVGGVDILLIFAQWMPHSPQGALLSAARNNNVKVVYSNSGGKREVCKQLALALDLPYGKTA